MGTNTKFLMAVKRRFWEPAKLASRSLTDGPINLTWDRYQQPARRNWGLPHGIFWRTLGRFDDDLEARRTTGEISRNRWSSRIYPGIGGQLTATQYVKPA